jgi:hypothetical protein
MRKSRVSGSVLPHQFSRQALVAALATRHVRHRERSEAIQGVLIRSWIASLRSQ